MNPRLLKDKKVALGSTLSVCVLTLAYILFIAGKHLESVEFAGTIVLSIIALLVSRIRENDAVKLFLLGLGSFLGMRFLWWRYNNSLNFEGIPNTLATLCLVSAETYTCSIFLMFAFQLAILPDRDEKKQERKKPSESYRPSVSIFIATYNEDIDILRRTISGCLSISYPNKSIYVLDDGRRQEVLDLADQFNVNYLTRPNNNHAKAGSLNNALGQTQSDFVLFLDADHVPAANIVDVCLAEFEHDDKLALVQCAHRFMNPGPVERNLRLEGKLPHEQELFFQLVQVGKDIWNAAFFAGSAAMARRNAIDAVGGIPTQTIAEDCELTVYLHKEGFRTRYLSSPGIIGLNPESMSSYLIQQRRWACGSAQLLSLQNPIFMSGLTFPQKLCYTAGMLHFLYGIPRLIYILTPCVFLILGLCPMRVDVFDYLVFVVPYLLLYLLNQNYIFKNFRHSFWSDVYEVINAPNLAYYTTRTLIHPKEARFQVTPKGIMLKDFCFNFGLVEPHFIILGICLFAYSGMFIQLACGRDVAGIFVNVLWNTYNVCILISAICVAIERPQSRKAHRIMRRMPASISDIQQPERILLVAETRDLNEFGAKLAVRKEEQSLQRGQRVLIQFDKDEGLIEIPSTVVGISERTDKGYSAHLKFDDLSANPSAMIALINVVYTSNLEWKVFREPADAISTSLFSLLTCPVNAIQNVLENKNRLKIIMPTELLKLAIWDKLKGLRPLMIDESNTQALTPVKDKLDEDLEFYEDDDLDGDRNLADDLQFENLELESKKLEQE